MGNTGKKIAFFSKGDDKFLEELVKELSLHYETRKITVVSTQEMKLIDQWMEWADVCWFEWCDELIVYASKLEAARNKNIICRLHSYEAFAGYPFQVNWEYVDLLVFVSENIRKYVIDSFGIRREITAVIPNGIDMAKWSFRQREAGFKAAYVGYINYKKGPMLLLHTFKAIYDRDNRYMLYIAGQFQDPRFSMYFNHMIREMGLENNFFFEGWQTDMDKWLEDKNYILCSSVLESQNMSVMQAMAKGIKPVVHNFVGADSVYERKYLWNTLEEAVSMVSDGYYDSSEYRKFIEDNYSSEKQYEATVNVIERISLPGKNSGKNTDENADKYPDKNNGGFDYKAYWNRRLNSNFNIEGVGYIGLGEKYNKLLYRNRMELLDRVITKAFEDISGKRVLELGPGIGVFTEYFSNKKVQAYEAIDIAFKSVCELKKKYPDYCFSQGDISSSNHYEGKYDLIFAADVLLHITDESQYERAIANIADHLGPEGYCMLLDPVSVINAKSVSPHVIIRDRNYVEKVLKYNGLELTAMFPVAYFMNYPFDREITGDKGNKALELFNLLQELFRSETIQEEDKENIGEYLLLKEKELLYRKGYGLSEKLLVVRKQGSGGSMEFAPEDMYGLSGIKSGIGKACEKLAQSGIAGNDLFGKAGRLLKYLEKDEVLQAEYVRERINDFISYKTEDFDAYDFSTASIMLGKRERTLSGYELIEFILNNKQDVRLAVNNIWYDFSRNMFILPGQMQDSVNSKEILRLAREIFGSDIEFKKNIAGFIYDQEIKEDVRKNFLAYMWERGIPASEFLPVFGYLKIAQRYLFAAGFIKEDHKVLEAPCGFGYGAAYFSKLCRQVEAIDIAEDNLTFAKGVFRHENIYWTQGDVTELPYENEEFDVYASFEVFEHLPVETAVRHIEEAHRVLKECGRFIVSTPNREMRKHVKNPFHIKEYCYDEFYEILKNVFQKVDFYSMNGYRIEKGMNPTTDNMIVVCEKSITDG